MKAPKTISSTQNPFIKRILLLQEKSRERKKSGLFVLEGIRELQLALKRGYQLETVFFQPQIISEDIVFELLRKENVNPELIALSQEVYEKVAYRETTEGIIALLKSKTHFLKDLTFSNKNPLLLIAEAPEKPGNIGALLRTADAAKLDAVIIANPLSDLYNPNIIRSSVGCVFTNAIAAGTTLEIIAFLKEQKIAVFCAALSASEVYTQIDFTGPTAIVVGTEAAGLTADWLKNSTKNIIIPMQGEIDSMNVSVSAAILIFEAKRQRNWN
jgi:TrmH family RNA methyltransferase